MTAECTDAEYVLDLCTRIAAATDVPGTITRTFLSPAARTVHALLRHEMEALGMQVRVDCAGNLRGVYGAASVAGSGRFIVGSHLDTVPDAGAYDGVLGVAIAIGMVRALEREGRRLRFALEVIAFSEEEGVRFRLPFIGSRAVTGTLPAEEFERRDDKGISLAQAIGDFGLDAEELSPDDANVLLATDAFGFLEVHIEQGPVLDAEATPLGVVGTIVGQSRYEVRFEGQANHAGTTPMHLRHDAISAAAAWIVRIEGLARNKPGLVATVGALRAEPGAANVIAGVCMCSLDVRHCEDELRLRAANEMLEIAEEEATVRGVRASARKTSHQDSVAMDGRLQRALLSAAEAEGIAVRRMDSGAGHDAMIMALRVPAAMLFVRSPGGISHHRSESVLAEDVQAAMQVCMRCLELLESGVIVGGGA